jgi:hypothetical protein
MNNFSKNVSKRLRIARLASGYNSAKEFTEKHSIPASTYSQHENGKRMLSVENIIHYSELTNVDPAWLMTGRGNPCGERLNQSDLEEKILAEQEKLEKTGAIDVIAVPLVSMEKKYSNVNIHIFKRILNVLLPLLKDIPDSKIEDVVDFCFDLYNRIVATNADGPDREKLIKIGFESFFKGMGIRITDEFIRNIVVV